MKKILNIAAVLALGVVALQGASSQAYPGGRYERTWHCSAASSRGYNYTWDSSDRRDAENGALSTCQQYEGPNYGTCYAPTCEVLNPYNQGSTYRCETPSSRGYNYSWDSDVQSDAEAESQSTCQRYEAPYGGQCYGTRCYRL
jgi:hypothetical protein